MARPKEPADARILTKVSSLYYLQDCTQSEIGRRLGVSTSTVSRLLQQARDRGMIQISIVPPNEVQLELEDRLEADFGLVEAIVLEEELPIDNPEIIKNHLGIAAAEYLRRTLAPGDTIGVTWGTTLQAMVQALPLHVSQDVRVVQTLGGVGPPEAKAHAADVARELARQLNSSLTLLPAPGIVDDARIRDVYLSDRQVQSAMTALTDLTVAYVGIGALSTNQVLGEVAAIQGRAAEELISAGAVGDIALRFFDADGKHVSTSLDDRLIGIDLDELKKVDRVVGIAGGPEKTAAVRAALLGGYVDVLITDAATARGVVGDAA